DGDRVELAVGLFFLVQTSGGSATVIRVFSGAVGTAIRCAGIVSGVAVGNQIVPPALWLEPL
ncbi:MAG: hypothetical protein KDD96_16175, partial [Rhodobacteraceae bacterium]|nr:hypothetical protein [Paracoccaceae bacterium]